MNAELRLEDLPAEARERFLTMKCAAEDFLKSLREDFDRTDQLGAILICLELFEHEQAALVDGIGAEALDPKLRKIFPAMMKAVHKAIKELG